MNAQRRHLLRSGSQGREEAGAGKRDSVAGADKPAAPSLPPPRLIKTIRPPAPVAVAPEVMPVSEVTPVVPVEIPEPIAALQPEPVVEISEPEPVAPAAKAPSIVPLAAAATEPDSPISEPGEPQQHPPQRPAVPGRFVPPSLRLIESPAKHPRSSPLQPRRSVVSQAPKPAPQPSSRPPPTTPSPPGPPRRLPFAPVPRRHDTCDDGRPTLRYPQPVRPAHKCGQGPASAGSGRGSIISGLPNGLRPPLASPRIARLAARRQPRAAQQPHLTLAEACGQGPLPTSSIHASRTCQSAPIPQMMTNPSTIDSRRTRNLAAVRGRGRASSNRAHSGGVEASIQGPVARAPVVTGWVRRSRQNDASRLDPHHKGRRTRGRWHPQPIGAYHVRWGQRATSTLFSTRWP